MPTEFEKVRSLFLSLDSTPLQRFPTHRGRLEVPSTHGVYAIVAPRGVRVLHVGRTVTGQKGLKHRISNHLHGRSSFVRLHLDGNADELRRAYWFKFVEVPDARLRALLEAYAIGQYCPAHIGIARSVLEAQEARRNAA